VHIDRKLENAELKQLGGTVRIGLDVLGGIAGLAEAMLAEAGFALVHVPGLAVNRARQGTVGGEHKSDPRDARVIAEQVRKSIGLAIAAGAASGTACAANER
jgi:Transposase